MIKEIKDSDFVENYSDGIDVESENFEDYLPEEKKRVYPYRTVGSMEEKPLIKESNTSIVRISQENLNSLYDLKIDENGFYYFEIWSAISEETGLTHGSGTSNWDNVFSKTKSFQAITNNYINVDENYPNFFTMDKPFNKDDYEKKTDDKQRVYFGNKIDISKINNAFNVLSESDREFLDKAENYKSFSGYSFEDSSSLFDNTQNSSIRFSTNINLGINPMVNYNGEKVSGISIETENYALVNSIKGLGSTINNSLFNNIDFQSEKKVIPLKFSIRDDQDKLTIGHDWWDYDYVMPYFDAKKFLNPNALSEVIKIPVDRKLVEDMIMISVGFAQEWKDAPRYTMADINPDANIYRSDVGRIKADFYIGHNLINIASIYNKKALAVIDGLYRNHLTSNPGFLSSTPRQQSFKSVVSALSSIIISSLAVGKGNNNFNEAYLPWFLELNSTSPIDIKGNPQIVSLIKTYLLPGTQYGPQGETKETNIRWIVKSSYFRKDYGDKINLKSSSILELPKNFNISRKVNLQTDRKISLPSIPDDVKPINKNNLPGDIAMNSMKDLQYMFYLPVGDENKDVWKKMFINNVEDKIITINKGDPITVYPPTGNANKNVTEDGTIVNANENILSALIGVLKNTASLSTFIPDADKKPLVQDYKTIKTEDEMKKWLDKYKDLFTIASANLGFSALGFLTGAYDRSNIIKPTSYKWIWGNTKYEAGWLKYNPRGSFLSTFSNMRNNAYANNKKIDLGDLNVSQNIKLEWYDYIFKTQENNIIKVSNDVLIGAISKALGYDLSAIRITKNDMRFEKLAQQGNEVGLIDFAGTAEFELAHLEFSPAVIKSVVDKTKTIQTFESRQVTFDRNEWIDFMNDNNILEGSKIKFNLKSDKPISFLSEIKIGSIFSNSFTISIGLSPSDVFNIESINQYDETIGIQSITIF